MHRLIAGATKGIIVDHWDRNGLNNRRYNLRFCSRLQNQANSPSTSRYKFKGLNFDKRCKQRPWQAIIKNEGRPRTLGFYATPEEAARAYDRAAIELYGEFALLNFAALEAKPT